MLDNGFRSAFISFGHKQRLRTESMKQILVFLENKGFNIEGIL